MIRPIRFAWGRTRRHSILSSAEGTAFNHGLSQSGVKRGTSNRKKTFVIIQSNNMYSTERQYPKKKTSHRNNNLSVTRAKKTPQNLDGSPLLPASARVPHPPVGPLCTTSSSLARIGASKDLLSCPTQFRYV